MRAFGVCVVVAVRTVAGALGGDEQHRPHRSVTNRALKEKGLPPEEITNLALGWTVLQSDIFYGAPTVAARIGAEGVSGPTISQACVTAERAVELMRSGRVCRHPPSERAEKNVVNGGSKVCLRR